MSYVFTVSPDFAPAQIGGWYVFNTWLQKEIQTHIRLQLYDDFDSQRDAIAADRIDLIYANPFDASALVRQKQFQAIAVPSNKRDEAVVVASVESGIERVENLKPGTRIAITPDPDVNLIGMIMLEPADLDAGSTLTTTHATHILVVKSLLQGNADVGFFLKEAYDELSQMVKNDLRVLVTSQISVIRHVMLVGPKAHEIKEGMETALLGMTDTPRGRSILDSLGFAGWDLHTKEDAEFMIDLMDTLMS